MTRTILVVGATGNYAQPVVWRLSQDGFDVRVFARNRNKAIEKFGDRFPIFEGNVEDPASLRPALAGCFGVHVSLRGWRKYWSHDRVEHLGTANVVRAAQEAGVDRLTYLSCVHARPENAHLTHLKAKLDAEAVIRASGLPFAIFAPTFFMENAHHLSSGDRIPVTKIPGHTFHYIAAQDYAAAVSRLYQLPQAPNRRFDLYGPEPISQAYAVKTFCSIVRPQTKYHFVPLWLSNLYFHLIRNENQKYAMRVVRMYQQSGEPGDPKLADTSLGRAATTYLEWCEAQRPAAG